MLSAAVSTDGGAVWLQEFLELAKGFLEVLHEEEEEDDDDSDEEDDEEGEEDDEEGEDADSDV
jgi:hypothetical protein